MIGRVRIVVANRATLRSNAHNLRLIACSFKVRAHSLGLRALLATRVLNGSFVQFEVCLRATASNAWSAFVAPLKLLLLITTAALVVLLQTTLGLALVVSCLGI